MRKISGGSIFRFSKKSDSIVTIWADLKIDVTCLNKTLFYMMQKSHARVVNQLGFLWKIFIGDKKCI